MIQTKIASRLLYYICLGLCAVYGATFIYSVFCLVTNTGITPYGENKYLHINFPFTEKPFLNIDNNPAYIVFSFLLVLFMYGIFFWFSAMVFRVFFQPRYFIQENIKAMKNFYVLNLFFPLPIAIVAGFFVELEGMIWILVIVHFMLGMFSLFLANIFRQGLHLQKEQDLFI